MWPDRSNHSTPPWTVTASNAKSSARKGSASPILTSPLGAIKYDVMVSPPDDLSYRTIGLQVLTSPDHRQADVRLRGQWPVQIARAVEAPAPMQAERIDGRIPKACVSIDPLKLAQCRLAAQQHRTDLSAIPRDGGSLERGCRDSRPSRLTTGARNRHADAASQTARSYGLPHATALRDR